MLEPDAVARLQGLAALTRGELLVVEVVAVVVVVAGDAAVDRGEEDGLDEPDAPRVRGRRDGGDAHLAAALSSVRCVCGGERLRKRESEFFLFFFEGEVRKKEGREKGKRVGRKLYLSCLLSSSCS